MSVKRKICCSTYGNPRSKEYHQKYYKELLKSLDFPDCLYALEPYIEEVIPKERENQYFDYSEMKEIDLIIEEYFHAA